MSPEKQRIAIAKACGWAKCRLTVRGNGAPGRRPSPYGIPPGRNYEAPIPDYLNDLNAMHEAVSTIDGFSRDLFADHLVTVTKAGRIDSYRDTLGAPQLAWHGVATIAQAAAAQRAEAFLRTIGKWEEGE